MDYIWKETFKDARILGNFLIPSNREAALDFDVVRTKIEATASIEGVPGSY